MKVVYVKTVIEKVREARDEAERLGKKIEYIELDNAEWREVKPLFEMCMTGMPFINYHIVGIEVRKAP